MDHSSHKPQLNVGGTIKHTSSTSWCVFSMACGSGSRQRGGIAGDMMGCWNTVVTDVVEQSAGDAMDDTSMTVLFAPL